MVWLGLAALVSVIVIVVFVRRRWGPCMQVSRATLRRDGLDGNARLVRSVARRVYPVRLVGIGGPAHRLDLTLIDENPQLDVCGVPARQLTPLVGRETYLVYHPVWAEIWLRTGMWSVRRVVALPREELLKEFDFIMHDPDGLGAEHKRYSKSVGTIQITVTARLHLYLEVLVKPLPARPGPGSSGRGFA